MISLKRATWYYISTLLMSCSFDSAVSFLGIYPIAIPVHVRNDSHTKLFTITLFITAQYWKQPTATAIEDGYINCGKATQ